MLCSDHRKRYAVEQIKPNAGDHTMKWSSALIGAAAALMLAACGVDNDGNETGAMAGSSDVVTTVSALEGTRWTPVSLNGETLEFPDAAREAFLAFQDGGYFASVGCNSIRGGFSIEDGAASFGMGASTLMACQPPLDRYEHALSVVLSETTTITLSDRRLSLSDSDGNERAVFEQST